MQELQIYVAAQMLIKQIHAYIRFVQLNYLQRYLCKALHISPIVCVEATVESWVLSSVHRGKHVNAKSMCPTATVFCNSMHCGSALAVAGHDRFLPCYAQLMLS